MIVYFISSIFIFLYGYFSGANKTPRKRKRFIFIAFGILILIASLRATDVGIDLAGHYVKRYNDIANVSWGDLPKFAAFTGYEIGYCVFTKVLSIFSQNPQLLLVVCSFLIFGSIAYFIYKESEDVVMSTMLLVLSCTYYMCLTMIRQSIAFALILVGFTVLDNSSRRIKNYIVFGLWILLASTFHYSALLCLSMLVIDHLRFTRRHIIYGFAAILVLYFFYQQIYSLLVGLVSGGENRYERYETHSAESMGNINLQTIVGFLLVFFVFLLAYYVLIWKKKKRRMLEGVANDDYSLDKRESFMLFMVLMASACRLLVFRMNIINRFTYYFICFVFVLCPHAIEMVHSSKNRMVLKQIVYLVYGVYFVWISMFFAGALYGTVPYHFFWE